jgi:hypothetical protein
VPALVGTVERHARRTMKGFIHKTDPWGAALVLGVAIMQVGGAGEWGGKRDTDQVVGEEEDDDDDDDRTFRWILCQLSLGMTRADVSTHPPLQLIVLAFLLPLHYYGSATSQLWWLGPGIVAYSFLLMALMPTLHSVTLTYAEGLLRVKVRRGLSLVKGLLLWLSSGWTVPCTGLSTQGNDSQCCILLGRVLIVCPVFRC